MTNNLKKYYIIYTYLQYEDKVAEEITKQAEFKKIDYLIDSIIVPKKEIKKISNGKLKTKEVKLLEGYIIIKANLTTELYMLIKSVKGVMNILMDRIKDKVVPSPVREEEVNRILGISNNISRPVECNYNIGDKLLITKGALENSTGEVTCIDHNSLKLNVNIFGSMVPVDVCIDCVRKIN